MKHALILVGLLLTTGCVMHPTVKLSNAAEAVNHPFTLVDQRPGDQAESAILSSVITNCAYGIARLGDQNVKPDRLRYLANRLAAEKGAVLSGKQVVVEAFSIYRNNQLKLRGGVMPNASGVAIAGLRGVECFADATYEGGYDLTENPAGENVAVVSLVVSIDGRVVRSRAVVTASGTPGQFPAAHDVWSRVIKEAVSQAVSGLVVKI